MRHGGRSFAGTGRPYTLLPIPGQNWDNSPSPLAAQTASRPLFARTRIPFVVFPNFPPPQLLFAPDAPELAAVPLTKRHFTTASSNNPMRALIVLSPTEDFTHCHIHCRPDPSTSDHLACFRSDRCTRNFGPACSRTYVLVVARGPPRALEPNSPTGKGNNAANFARHHPSIRTHCTLGLCAVGPPNLQHVTPGVG